jgi:uncharacterized SAM-binding protein YcdF (DUF218 family)
MFFYLSQFFSILFMPLTIVLLLMGLSIFFPEPKRRKNFRIAAFVLLLFFSNEFLSNLAMTYWEPDFKSFEELPTYEYGVVLTGVTNLSKTAHDRTFFDKGADRVTHAMQLYKLGKVKKILITGGQGFDPTNDNTEALLLQNFLILSGVNEQDIILEDQAKNTYQNAIFSQKILQGLDYNFNQPLLIITSAFHMKRSQACFIKAGMNVHTFPVDYYSEDINFNIQTLMYPQAESLIIWNRLFKEWTGLVIYKVAGYI